MPKEDYVAVPTQDLINLYIHEFDNYNQNAIDDAVLRTVFTTYDNSSIENVLIKTILLNNRYSAGLNDRPSERNNIAIDVYNMSVIISNGFREVNTIQEAIDSIESINNTVVRDARKKKAYSFLSKYYYWTYEPHDQMKIPIYDGYARGMLYYLSKKDTCDYLPYFKQDDIATYRDYYAKYVSVLEQINLHLQSDFSVREFDKYLWMYAKELEQNHHINIKI